MVVSTKKLETTINKGKLDCESISAGTMEYDDCPTTTFSDIWKWINYQRLIVEKKAPSIIEAEKDYKEDEPSAMEVIEMNVNKINSSTQTKVETNKDYWMDGQASEIVIVKPNTSRFVRCKVNLPDNEYWLEKDKTLEKTTGIKLTST